VKESGEKLEFAAWGRNHRRVGAGDLNTRENFHGSGPSWSGDGTLVRRYGRLP
jgi:hypothetical protein